MKRIRSVFLCAVMAIILITGGCAVNKKPNHEENSYTAKTQNSVLQNETVIDAVTEKVTGKVAEETTEEATKDTTEDITQALQKLQEIPMLALPEGIKGIKAETEPNKELRDLIIEYMEIPAEFYETTRYYYNSVDLDDDGKKEIFAMVSGPYTSGTGGSSGIWVSELAGSSHIIQDFTLVNAPVIISNKKTNGYHELIIPYYGENKNQYSVLKFKDGEYNNVPDGDMIDSLKGITGEAILANDYMKEIEAGITGLNLLSD